MGTYGGGEGVGILWVPDGSAFASTVPRDNIEVVAYRQRDTSVAASHGVVLCRGLMIALNVRSPLFRGTS